MDIFWRRLKLSTWKQQIFSKAFEFIYNVCFFIHFHCFLIGGIDSILSKQKQNCKNDLKYWSSENLNVLWRWTTSWSLSNTCDKKIDININIDEFLFKFMSPTCVFIYSARVSEYFESNMRRSFGRGLLFKMSICIMQNHIKHQSFQTICWLSDKTSISSFSKIKKNLQKLKCESHKILDHSMT